MTPLHQLGGASRSPKEAACEKQASSSGMLTEYRDRILEPNRFLGSRFGDSEDGFPQEFLVANGGFGAQVCLKGDD